MIATPATMTLASIHEEIRGGLLMDRERMDCAATNMDFFKGKNARHLEPREGETISDFGKRPKAYSRLTRKAVSELTSLLYSPGPAREVNNPAAAEWLELIWKANHINRVMRQADVRATLNDCCAIQAVAKGDDKRPIQLYLWNASEFAVFLRDDDPCEPWAVCTKSVMTKGLMKWRQYEVWSNDEHRVYTTKPIKWTENLDTTGGTAAEYNAELSFGQNPYKVIPFAFVWNDRPVDEFWSSGIGSMLRETNETIDEQLCDIAQHMSEFLNPRGFAKNVPAGTRLLEKVGRFTILPQNPGAIAGDNNLAPEVMYLQAQLGAEAAWWNVTKEANQTFHELNIPLSAVRDDQQGPTSGFQIVAEQAPLVRYTKSRQPEFAEYEETLAKLILTVSGNYYGMPELVAAAAELELSLTWTPPAPASRSPEMDDHERNDFTMGLTSRIGILMERGLTREEAIQRLERVAEDRELEEKLFPDVIADPTQPVMEARPAEEDKPEPEDDGVEIDTEDDGAEGP